MPGAFIGEISLSLGGETLTSYSLTFTRMYEYCVHAEGRSEFLRANISAPVGDLEGYHQEPLVTRPETSLYRWKLSSTCRDM